MVIILTTGGRCFSAQENSLNKLANWYIFRLFVPSTETMSLYSSIYQAHDTILLQKTQEKAAQEERRAKKQVLETCYDDLTELPALSSFIHITDALDSQASSNPEADPGGSGKKKVVCRDGFERMQRCRMALEALDQGGWKRSYHQRLFHEAYIAACARPFWKLDPPGAFARAHQKILEMNDWESLSQEILISTPRRSASYSCHCARTSLRQFPNTCLVT